MSCERRKITHDVDKLSTIEMSERYKIVKYVLILRRNVRIDSDV